MINEEDILIDDLEATSWKEPSEVHTALSYLRGYARSKKNDRHEDLMKADQQWTQATQRLYQSLSESDRELLDSYAIDGRSFPGLYKKKRDKRMKHLALLLLIEVGKQSAYTMLLPVGDDENETKANTEEPASGSK